MIISIEGQLGKGKTLFMTFLALIYQMSGYTILSTYDIYLDNIIRLTHLSQLTVNYEKAVILLDDSFGMIDARSSGSQKNKFITQILLMSRKHNCDIVYTQQYEKLVDIRLRQVTNVYIYPLYDKEKDVFLMPILILKDGLVTEFSINPVPLFSMYNTNEVVDVSQMELQSKQMTRQQYLEQLDNYVTENNYILEDYTLQENLDYFYIAGFDSDKLNKIFLRQFKVEN